jgi:hypothetical protein
MNCFPCFMALALWLGGHGPALATDLPPQAGSTVPSDPVFKALRLDGSTASGRISRLTADEVTLAGDNETSLPLRSLVKLTREGIAPPYPPEGTVVLLPDGDRLRGVIGASGETKLEVRSYALGDVEIPLDSLLGLVLAPPTDRDAFEDLLLGVRTQKRSSEVLWLANGDRLAGGLLGLSSRHVSFQPQAGKVAVDRSQVVAIGFDPNVVSYPPPKADYLELMLADGSRLASTDVRIARGQVEATTRFGAPIHFPIGELARIHVRSENIAYLSDRAADAVDYVPYLGPRREYRRDLAVDGKMLRLAGQVYDHGIGSASRTLLAYRLKPGDRRFQALVGLDERAGPQGSVVFRVRLGREDKFVSPPMSMRDPPRPIDIDVSGAQVLILVTEYGERGNVRDFADWVEARLIR